MKTVKREIDTGQTILLEDGNAYYVEDFDGSFYFLEGKEDGILHHTIVDVVVSDEEDVEE